MCEDSCPRFWRALPSGQLFHGAPGSRSCGPDTGSLCLAGIPAPRYHLPPQPRREQCPCPHSVSSQWRPGLLVPCASFIKQPLLHCSSPSPPGVLGLLGCSWPCFSSPLARLSPPLQEVQRVCPRRWQMLHTLRSLACLATLHLPELVPRSFFPFLLVQRMQGPQEPQVHPRTRPRSRCLSRRRGHAPLGWSHFVSGRSGEVLHFLLS